MKKLYATLVIALFAITASAQIDRTQMPKPGPAPEINIADPQRFELKNGLKVLVVENHKLPRVSIQLQIDNPPVAEGNEAGVASLTASLLGKGSKSITMNDFNEEVDFLGARINFGAQNAFASCLSKYFPRITELMADAAINPNFTEDEFAKEKDILLTALKSQEKDVKAISRRAQTALAYGKKHPYGEFATEETINNVTLGDIKTFYDQYFVPANAYLVVVGDVTLEETKKLVEEHFTQWTKAVPPSFTFSKPTDVQYTQISFIDAPNAVQSEITVQNLVNLKKNEADYLPALMANEILGGGGEGRLFLNLREDKGYTYGSYSRLGTDKYAPARFRATASVRNMVTDSSVVELLKEIDKIRTSPVTEVELKNTKAKYVGRFVMALEDPSTIANYALSIETENLPKDFYRTYLEKINAITIDDVQKAAQKYISADKARVVVTGKGSEVLENLEKISFKGKTLPIKYFDTYAVPQEKPDYKATIPDGMTATNVLNTYITAIGGEEKLNGVASYSILAEAEMQGTKLNLEMKKTAKNQFMQDLKVMGNSMSKQVLNDGRGYMVLQGQRKDMNEEELKKVREEAAPFPELNYLKSGVTMQGMETVNGKKAFKVKVSNEKTSFYDMESGLKVQDVTITETQGQKIINTITFDNYKEVSGILFPFYINQSMGPQSLEFIVKEVKVNEGVTDADFE